MTIYEVNAPDAQSILVKGLVPFTTYRLRLIATNVVGSSPPSEPCKEFQTIQAPPRHPPRNVTVRAVSANNLRVRWIVSATGFIALSAYRRLLDKSPTVGVLLPFQGSVPQREKTEPLYNPSSVSVGR